MGHVATIANALFFSTVHESRREDASATRQTADALLRLSEQYGIKTYAEMGHAFVSWAHGLLVDPEAGAAGLRQALAACVAQGDKGGAPWLHGRLAELETATGGLDCALTQIDQGLAIANETGAHLIEPHLHRQRGEILLRRDPANPSPAEDAFKTALAIAQQQGSRSFGLRAALSLAKLYQSTGRPVDAHAVLAPALEGFAPTPEMPEIAEAQTLLAALADSDEVKGAPRSASD